MELVFEAQQLQNFPAPLRILAAIAVNALRQPKIPVSGKCWKQVETLKHKANFAPSDVGAFSIRSGGQVFVVNDYPASGWREQTAQQVEHRGLAASRSE